jgi:FlaA1/EpsC-like NDP-sugar epimerase
VEDLLHRDPVTLDIDNIAAYLTGKRVMVTGAGGSIGSELCRQVMKMNPQTLYMLGRGENSIYEINQELRESYDPAKLVPIISNVVNRKVLAEVFASYKPQVVFHAAAHKHVPLMEAQPREAVMNNVWGSWNVGELAGENGAEAFVMISTDKAVNPTSVMGATKRVGEKIMQSLNNKYATHYMAVRFGNVLGSRGSVVPLFKKQIAKGGPVTVTDPEMKRYFMTIPEATSLVIQAGSMGKGGEVFVLDMGEPVKIVDLARNLIHLAGQDEASIEIKFTGLRPGEKLFEELLTDEEGTLKTTHKKIFQAMLIAEDPDILRAKIEKVIAAEDEMDIIEQLKNIIPTYTPNHF